MIVPPAVIVMDVRGPQMARHRFDRLAKIAHQVRVAVVETDADVEPLELILYQAADRGRTREGVRHHFEGDAHVHIARQGDDLFHTAPRGIRLVVTGWRRLAVWNAKVHDEVFVRNPCSHLQRGVRLRDRRFPPCFITRRDGKRSDPLALPDCINDGRVHRMELETQIGEPFRELVRRARIPIVEMGARGEHLDRLEAVPGDIGKVLAGQPRFMEQMRGDAKALVGQTSILAGPQQGGAVFSPPTRTRANLVVEADRPASAKAPARLAEARGARRWQVGLP